MIDPCDPGAISPGAPLDPRSLRDDVVAYARSLADLGANPVNAEARARYLELIAPGETARRAAEMATMSGCELLGRALWRRYILHAILESPYRDRQAGADLLAIAREAGAATSGLSRWPDRGDVVIVGGGPEHGGSEHAWTSLASTGDAFARVPGEYLETHEGLDGGQLDGAKCQVIRLRAHELHAGWDSTSTYRRRVQWVLDVARIVERFGR